MNGPDVLQGRCVGALPDVVDELGRYVDGVNRTVGANLFGEEHGHEAGARTDIGYVHPGLEAKRVDEPLTVGVDLAGL